jgi:hypothetical protein
MGWSEERWGGLTVMSIQMALILTAPAGCSTICLDRQRGIGQHCRLRKKVLVLGRSAPLQFSTTPSLGAPPLLI